MEPMRLRDQTGIGIQPNYTTIRRNGFCYAARDGSRSAADIQDTHAWAKQAGKPFMSALQRACIENGTGAMRHFGAAAGGILSWHDLSAVDEDLVGRYSNLWFPA